MYPGRNNLYDSAIRRMVRESLEKQDLAFAQEYAQQDDMVLTAYLRDCAKNLGHSPHPREIIGGPYLVERFGDWANALEKAGLPMPTTPDKPSQFLLVQEETEAQKRQYRIRKEEKRRRAQIRKAEQARKKAEKDQNPQRPKQRIVETGREETL